MTPFDAPGKEAFENTVGKGEIARNDKKDRMLVTSTFSFLTMFSAISMTEIIILATLNFHLQMLSIWVIHLVIW